NNLEEEWPRIYGGDGFQMAFHPFLENTFFAETQNGNIVVTNDGGDFWDSATNGIDGEDRRNWDMQYILSPHNPEVFYTGTYRVYQGANSSFPDWFPISEDLTDGLVLHPRYHSITCINESPLEEGQLYVGTTDGNVWRSSPTGSGWTSINEGLPDRYVSDVKPSPDFVDGVYASMSAYKDYDFSPYIYRSMDRGESWESIAGDLPNLSINDMYIYPNTGDSILFVATDGGVYATIDAGTEWHRLGTNMPFVAANDLEVNFVNNELVVGTYARSINVYPLDSLFSVNGEDPVANQNLAVLEADLQLTPNPSSGQTQLSWQNLATDKTQLQVFDNQGRMVWSTEFIPAATQGRQQINLPEHLTAGMYILRVSQGKKIKALQMNLID
ncbi:MAG: T9SS type A sorting domain-containing protein, partial [Bacteroidota bacterium]